MVEKSVLLAFFFCMSAVLSPPSMMTLAIFMNTIINAISPYSDGRKSRARHIDTMNEMPCTLNLSDSFQTKECSILCLLNSILLFLFLLEDYPTTVAQQYVKIEVIEESAAQEKLDERDRYKRDYEASLHLGLASNDGPTA